MGFTIQIDTSKIKRRDKAVVSCIQRKKGAHKNRRKEADKKACRGKVQIPD